MCLRGAFDGKRAFSRFSRRRGGARRGGAAAVKHDGSGPLVFSDALVRASAKARTPRRGYRQEILRAFNTFPLCWVRHDYGPCVFPRRRGAAFQGIAYCGRISIA